MSKQVLAIIGAIVGVIAIAGIAYLAISRYLERKKLEEYYYDDEDCFCDCDDLYDIDCDCCDEDAE